MGNCLRSNRVTAQDHHPQIYNSPATEQKKPEPEAHKLAGRSAMAKAKTTTGAKKVVRFNLEDHENPAVGGGGGAGEAAIGDAGGVVRIKVVVSQKELKQILKDRENDSCSVEELIAELRVKGRASTISDAINQRPRLPLRSTVSDSEDI